MATNNTVVLAYSGGLDTSCILVWLREKGYDVVAFLADLGQEEDFEEARVKAEKLGAKKVVIKNLQKELVEEFTWTAVRADLIYEDRYLLGTAIARPCIVKGLIEVADEVNAGYISHGATGKGNDQIRFELGVYALRPKLKIISPWKDEEFYKKFQGRRDLFEYAKEHNIPLPVKPSAPWSIDANLLHVSYESGILDNPASAPPPGLCTMTRDPENSPDEPSLITITFDKGIPCCLSEKTVKGQESITGSLEIFKRLNALGSLHGIGRIDIVENRFIGLKVRGVYETPGLTILREAHMDLELMCLDREVRRLKQYLSARMSEQVYSGFWFSPEFEFTEKCIEESQKNVSGTVNLKLYKGRAYVLGRDSPKSLYNEELASMNVQGDYEPNDAAGFIKLNALRLREHRRIMNSD